MRLAALLFSACLAGPAMAADWATYVNARFGTAVEYPADVLVPEPESENGDGHRFHSADGRASLTVFAGHNVTDMDLRALVRSAHADAAGDRITYERIGRRWFVLSGFRGENVFYRKLLLSPDGSVAHTLEIVYPASQKRLYDPLTARMANSLSGR